MRTWIATIFDGGRGKRVKGQKGKREENLFVLILLAVSPFGRFPFWPFRPSSQGFTLLELSVVLFIIGLLVTVTLPRLSSFNGGGTEAGARRLSALVRYLSNEAAVSGHPYRLHYDLDQRAYWVTVFTPTRAGGEFLRDDSPLSRRVQLPSAVAFVDVFIPGSGRVQSGQVYTNFYPQGYADPTIIHLRDQYAQITTVTIPPLTGEAWITDGYTDGFVPRR